MARPKLQATAFTPTHSPATEAIGEQSYTDGDQEPRLTLSPSSSHPSASAGDTYLFNGLSLSLTEWSSRCHKYIGHKYM